MAKSKRPPKETKPPANPAARPSAEAADQTPADEEDFEHVLRRLVIARDKL